MIQTLGCKVNQYETQQIRALLENLGMQPFSVSDESEGADLVIVNTCCVTQTASAKCRQMIRKAAKQNPNCSLVICGCLPRVNTEELHDLRHTAHIVKNRNNLAQTLSQIVADRRFSQSKPSNPESNFHPNIISKNGEKIKSTLPNLHNLPKLTRFHGQTRAFLKVQDGCDAYCSYCIVPFTRPNVRSRPLVEVISEAKALVASGHKEIVLTGVFLGAYGQDTVRRRKWSDKSKLSELVSSVAQVPGLARLRLSSLEPGDLTEELLEVFCRFSNILPHFHLALQSGCDSVLKRMGRHYGTQEFREKVELARKMLDRPAITTDVIVGFPGETEDEFEKTFSFCSEIGFSKMHVFPFSVRRGTAAAKMKPTVPATTKKQRAAYIRDLDEKMQFAFRERFIGEQVIVLTEQQEQGRAIGLSERYFPVQICSDKLIGSNQLLSVRLIENSKEHATGIVTAAKTMNVK